MGFVSRSRRYRPHPHEQRAVHGQGEVHRGVPLQRSGALHLQTQPGRVSPLQRAQHRPAGDGASGRRQRVVGGPSGGADGRRRREALGRRLQRELGHQRGHGGLSTARAGLRFKSSSSKPSLSLSLSVQLFVHLCCVITEA